MSSIRRFLQAGARAAFVAALAPLALRAQTEARYELDGNLDSATGQAALEPIGYPGVPGAPGVTFENATIAGGDAQVARVSEGTALVVHHGAPANGGGAYVNQYTIILDVNFPQLDQWISLYQTNDALDQSQGNDGDWFVNPDNAIGIEGNYGGTLQANTWHRIALAFDSAAFSFTSYIDGVQVQQILGDPAIDSRWTLYGPSDADPPDYFILFADDSGPDEQAEILVNSFAFFDRTLSAAEIAALRGPSAEGASVAGPVQAPANDSCADATELALPATLEGSTAAAAPDNTGICSANGSPAVWAKVVGTGADISAELCGSSFDTRMALYTGSCDALVCAGENDDSCGLGSRIYWSSTAGTEYFLAIFGTGDGDAGGYVLTVREAPVPANDLCADAIALELAGGQAVADGTTRGATPDTADAPECGTIRAPGVWYSVVGTGGVMEASTCNTAPFDSRLSIFQGDCGALECVAENDDADGCGNASSRVGWSSTFDATYHILVHGFDALPGRYHVGDFGLTVTGDPRPCLEITECRADQAQKIVELAWTTSGSPAGFEVLVNGVVVETLGAEIRALDHSPALAAGRLNDLVYTVRGIGVENCSASCEATLSPGNVCFADDFESYAGDIELEFANWALVDVNDPAENATWTLTNPGTRANPPAFNGRPTRGQFIVSDSDSAGGDNPTGSGQSHDIWSPPFSAAAKTALWLHADVSAQLNNNGVAVFDVDYSTDGGQNWTNAFRRVGPVRTVEPIATIENTDGYFGRLDVDLSAAAGQESVRFRLRHFEPSDDWWIAVDNVIVDDVPATAGGTAVLLAEETFAAGIPETWIVRSLVDPPNEGALTWSVADPCLRDVVANNGGTLPYQDGHGVNRLEAPFALLDSDCDPDPVEDEYLITPAVDASGQTEVFLHFKSEIVTSGAISAVLLSLDGGETFEAEPLLDYRGGGLVDTGEDPFYAENVIAVPAAAGESNVAFAFHWGGQDDWWWAVDDVSITGTPAAAEGGLQVPGDCNQDGGLDIADGVCVFGYLFQGNPTALPCGDGLRTDPGNRSLLDWQPDGNVDISDGISTLNYLFTGGPPHPLAAAEDPLRTKVPIVGCPDVP